MTRAAAVARRLSERDPLYHLLPTITRETDDQRWLRQNAAAIQRAHAEMLAEQDAALASIAGRE